MYGLTYEQVLQTALKEIFKKIGNLKKNDNQKNLSGKLFMHLEKQRRTYIYAIDKYGVVKHDPFSSPEQR
ncbi:MAG: hypothetical protein IJ158_06735 [Treponema sp.]|nr:hypothetical protein [Treponema sp.]